MGPYQWTPKEVAIGLLDSQVEGSVQWVLFEISWKMGMMVVNKAFKMEMMVVHSP